MVSTPAFDVAYLSPAERLASMDKAQQKAFLQALTPEDAVALLHEWRFWARPKQLAPKGDWFCWLVIAGRGFGKTRLGAEWVRELVEGETPLTAKGDVARIALIADSFADARDIMVEGESGILACAAPDQRPRFETTRRRLVWPNGAIALLYSAEDPDQLRGPQHHAAWGDEIAKWQKGEDVWSNLLLGLRLGQRPRVLATTTPRPIPLLRELIKAPGTVVTRGSTLENTAHLSSPFLAQVMERYGGTRLGRQEIDGEILEDANGALWTHAMIEAGRVREAPPLSRIVIAIDPPVGSHEGADACGIIAAGRGEDDGFYILGDYSVQGLSPDGWARRAVDAYEVHNADRLIAEVNNGGDLVENVMRSVAPHVSYRAVRASRGKLIRAEPIAALYERGRVHHVGLFADLEDEMCTYRAGIGQKSPDRMDALVWALSDLSQNAPAQPRIRGLSGN